MKIYLLLVIGVVISPVDYASCRDIPTDDVMDNMADMKADKLLPTERLMTVVISHVTASNDNATSCASLNVDDEVIGNVTWPETDVGGTASIVREKSICDARVLKDCLDGGEWANTTYEECNADKVQPILIMIGFSVSLVACLISFIIFMMTRSSLRSLGHYQYHIHWSLIASFISYQTVFIISYLVIPTALVQALWLRNLLMVLLAYFVLANFFWMLVEGLVLLVLVATSFPGEQHGRAFVKWCVTGWGIPAVLVVSWIVVNKATTPAESPLILLLNKQTPQRFACLIAPVLVALLINCVVLVIVMRILWQKLKADVRNSTQESHENYWRTAKSTVVLMVLLGVYYALPIIVSLVAPPFKLNYVVGYISNLVSSVQGLAVSTFYVFCNAEVKRVLRNHRRKWRYTGTGLGSSLTTRLSSRSSSRSGTPRNSKSHSSTSDGVGGGSYKRPSREIDDIEMTTTDLNQNIKDGTEKKKQMCVIMELAQVVGEGSRDSVTIMPVDV